MCETPLALIVLLRRVCQVKIVWLVQTIAGGCVKHIPQPHSYIQIDFKHLMIIFITRQEGRRTTNQLISDSIVSLSLGKERPPYTLCMPRLYKYIVLISDFSASSTPTTSKESNQWANTNADPKITSSSKHSREIQWKFWI